MYEKHGEIVTMYEFNSPAPFPEGSIPVVGHVRERQD